MCGLQPREAGPWPAARGEGVSIMRAAMSRAPVVVALGCLVALMAAFPGYTKTSPASTSPNLAPETTLTARGEPAPGAGVCIGLVAGA